MPFLIGQIVLFEGVTGCDELMECFQMKDPWTNISDFLFLTSPARVSKKLLVIDLLPALLLFFPCTDIEAEECLNVLYEFLSVYLSVPRIEDSNTSIENFIRTSSAPIFRSSVHPES